MFEIRDSQEVSAQGRDIVLDPGMWSRYRLSVTERKSGSIRWIDDGSRAFLHHNPSMYLTDGGLWTACKESRRVMEQRFKTTEWSAIREERRHNRRQLANIDMMPATGYFVAENSERRYFTVFPHHDLFCLQPQSLKSLDGEFFFYRNPIGGYRWGFEGLKHVALEFDPAWGIEVKKSTCSIFSNPEIVDEIIRVAFEMPEVDTVWFIDRNIKRKNTAPAEEEEAGPRPKVFYQNGCRLVEVVEEDPTDQWEEVYETDGGDYISCRHFLDTVEDVIREYEEYNWDNPNPNIYDGEFPATLGVLACEYF